MPIASSILRPPSTIANKTGFDEALLDSKKEAAPYRSEESSSGLRAFGTHCNTGADQKRGGQHRLIAAIYAPLVRQGANNVAPKVQPRPLVERYRSPASINR